MSNTHIKLWYNRFEGDCKSIESDTYSGRHSISRTPKNVEYVQATVNENQQQSVQELEEDLDILWTCLENLTDLGMKHVGTKFMCGCCH